MKIVNNSNANIKALRLTFITNPATMPEATKNIQYIVGRKNISPMSIILYNLSGQGSGNRTHVVGATIRSLNRLDYPLMNTVNNPLLQP